MLYGGVALALGEVTVASLRMDGQGRATLQRARGAWLLALVALLTMLAAQCVAMEIAPHVSDVVVVLRETTWGRGWTSLAFIAVLGGLCAVARAPVSLRAISACALAMAMGGLGHAAADSAMPATVRALDAAHVIGMGVWIGMLLCVPPSFSEREWSRVSAVATVVAPATVLTGIGSALRRVWDASSITQILASDYGKLLLLKVALVAVVLVFAMMNRKQLRANGAPTATRLRAELLIALAVFAVTAVLTGTAPPGE